MIQAEPGFLILHQEKHKRRLSLQGAGQSSQEEMNIFESFDSDSLHLMTQTFYFHNVV